MKIMKYLFVFMLAFVVHFCSAQQHKLVKLWETDTIIAVPESVLPSPNNKNLLYVSLIDGLPWGEDGKGGVATISADGKNYDPSFITGLNAPKGMGIIGNKLYVADMAQVVVININKKIIEQKITIEGAERLNDLTVGKDVVYVSDSKLGKIWQLKNNKPSLYHQNISGANGLKFLKNELYYAQGKQLMKIDKNKKISKVAEVSQGIDGIEQLTNGYFILTSWPGYIFYVNKNGSYETILETHEQKKNTADLGIDVKNSIIYVPTFNGKTIVAYKVQ